MTLKIATGTEPEGDVDLDGLFPGDSIMASVTHEVTQMGGDKTWAKYAASTTMQAGETPEQAYRRLEKHVNDGAIRMAKTSHEVVVREVQRSLIK